MREIKFRAWNKTNKEWIKDNFYLDLRGEAFSLGSHSCECGTRGEHQEGVGDYEIMQFTGLKDKNGKEIYEGDIVDFNTMGVNELLRAEYDGLYVIKTGQEITPNEVYCEIIGNIYENPELLS